MLRITPATLFFALVAACHGTTDPGTADPADTPADVVMVGHIYSFTAAVANPGGDPTNTVTYAGTIKITQADEATLAGDFYVIRTMRPVDTAISPNYTNNWGTITGQWTGSSYEARLQPLDSMALELHRGRCAGTVVVPRNDGGRDLRTLTSCSVQQ